MDRPFLTPRELLVWAACFLAGGSLIVLTGFTSLDPDSALYVGISGKLAGEPPSRWIAPLWWGFWGWTHLFREHPAGLMMLPATLGKLGIPGVQAAYVQGVAAQMGVLMLIGVLVSRVTRAAEGRAAMLFLQVMPVAFIFRVRSNHEYPMLFWLVLTLVALDNVRHRSWLWAAVVALAISAALVIKGVFVVLILIAAGLWILLNPTRRTGSMTRPIVAVALALVAAALVAWGYDLWYFKVTGETFWAPYLRRQLGPVTVASPTTGALTALHHLGFYVLRIVWHPAPWSAAVLMAAWHYRGRLVATVRSAAEGRTVLFCGLFVLAVIGLLFPLSRFAERYAFSATYTVGTIGVVLACRNWKPIQRMDRWWASSSTAAAVLWLILIVLRLVVGPMLPRLQ